MFSKEVSFHYNYTHSIFFKIGKETEQLIVKSHPEEMLQFQSLSEIDKTGKSKIHV